MFQNHTQTSVQQHDMCVVFLLRRTNPSWLCHLSQVRIQPMISIKLSDGNWEMNTKYNVVSINIHVLKFPQTFRSIPCNHCSLRNVQKGDASLPRDCRRKCSQCEKSDIGILCRPCFKDYFEDKPHKSQQYLLFRHYHDGFSGNPE